MTRVKPSFPLLAGWRSKLPAATLLLLLGLTGSLVTTPPTFRSHALRALANPDLAISLLLTGVLLLYAEANLPGTILPGALGTLAAMLSIFGLTRSALHPAAVAFVAVGLALLLLEPKLRAHGLLAVAGTAAIIYGLTTLTHPPMRPAVAFATGSTFALVTLPLARIVLLARRNKQTLANPHHTCNPPHGSMQGKLS